MSAFRNAAVSTLARAALCAASLGLVACGSRPRMCTGGECGAEADCIAGRCQAKKGVAAIQGAERLIVPPVAMALSGVAAGQAIGPELVLGRERGGVNKLHLRFEVVLPPGKTLVEAYLLLERTDAVPADPQPIRLHLERILEPWSPATIADGREPPLEDVRAAETLADPRKGRVVRVDARALVRPTGREEADFGLAVLVDGKTRTGVAFSTGLGEGPPPRLELYVR